MRTWLVVPPRPRGQTLNLIPPVGLGYLATACRASGHAVEIVDCPLEGLAAGAFVERVRAAAPEVVGFSVFTTDLETVGALCRLLKALPRPPVLLLGGIHPSSAPARTLEEIPEADYLFAGEAEPGLPALLDLLSGGTPAPERLAAVPGLGWRDGGAPRVNAKVYPEDLGALGMPAWDLLRPRRYQDFPPTLFVRQRPYAPIITSRGCPYPCTYCGGHNVSGRRPRRRPLDLVLREIELLHREHGIRELHIEDDNFTLDREWVAAFCERLIASGWGLSWATPNGVRLDTLDLELLRLMKRAGCYFLIIGAESGSDRVLASVRKRQTVRQIEEQAALVREAGILVHAFFMVGFPGERPEDLRATMELSLRLPLVGAHFASFRPLPGTECAERLAAEGEIAAPAAGPAAGTFATVVYAPRGMTVAEVKAWQRRMLLAFYLRPRILWFYLREAVRNPFLVASLLRRVRLYLLGGS